MWDRQGRTTGRPSTCSVTLASSAGPERKRLACSLSCPAVACPSNDDATTFDCPYLRLRGTYVMKRKRHREGRWIGIPEYAPPTDIKSTTTTASPPCRRREIKVVHATRCLQIETPEASIWETRGLSDRPLLHAGKCQPNDELAIPEGAGSSRQISAGATHIMCLQGFTSRLVLFRPRCVETARQERSVAES